MDRERNRVLVAEALQRAAAAANTGNMEAACTLLADTQAMLLNSPSTLHNEPLGVRLLEVVSSGLLRREPRLNSYAPSFP